MELLRILITDDHALVRDGLKLLFKTQNDFRVVGEATRGEEACRLVKDLTPDVVLMDVIMPGLGGAKATKRLLEISPDAKVIAFSAYEDEIYVRQLMLAGASGYVLKRTVTNELINAIRLVAQGGTYLDPAVAHKLAAARIKPVMPREEELSAREVQVLRLTARGLTNKEIGEMLGISIKTVETYRSRLSHKLHLRTRADIVRYALEQGWLDEPAPV